jgi:hypothetical protein
MNTQTLKFCAILNVAILLGIFLIQKSCQLNRLKALTSNGHKTDTVYVSKPYEVIKIEKEYIEKPIKVYVYKRDTLYRKQLENSTLISAIDIKQSGLFNPLTSIKIDKIDTLGLLFRDEFNFKNPRQITIDHLGNLQVKEKKMNRSKTLKIIGGIAVGIAGSYLIYQKVK